MAEPATSIGVDPLVDEAWRLALAEGGGTVAVLIVAVIALWKWAGGLMTRMQAQADEQRKATEKLMERLVDEQGKALHKVSEAVAKVEGAVSRLDSHMTAAMARLDRHETKLEDHGHRLVRLELSGESGIRHRPRAAGD